MTIQVTVVVGPWVGNKRVHVLHRTAGGTETKVAALEANNAHQTIVCDGQDIVVREVDAQTEEPGAL